MDKCEYSKLLSVKKLAIFLGIVCSRPVDLVTQSADCLVWNTRRVPCFCLYRWFTGWKFRGLCYRCHYTKSNPIDDHSNISSKKLQKQNFKPLGHYTCMQCGTSHLQKVQENILSRIILATYRKFTVATVRFTQNVTGNIFTHPIYQQVANVTV